MATHININQDEKLITEICNNSPHLVLRTQCGTGKYVFSKITYRKEKLVLEFKLVRDGQYQDTDKISLFLSLAEIQPNFDLKETVFFIS